MATSDDGAYLVSSDLRLIIRPNRDTRVPWTLDSRYSIPFQEKDLSQEMATTTEIGPRSVRVTWPPPSLVLLTPPG